MTGLFCHYVLGFKLLEGMLIGSIVGSTDYASVSGHEIILNEGDSLFFDSGAKHGMKAMNGKPAKFLAIIL